MQNNAMLTIEQREFLISNPLKSVADFHAQNEFLVQNWMNNVSTFFDWMNQINGYHKETWIMTNLKKYLVTKHDLDQWVLLFSLNYDGDFDYILKCSLEFVKNKKEGRIEAYAECLH